MKETKEKLLNELISKIENKDDLVQIQDQLFKRGVENLLKAELTAHLGYSPHEKSDTPKSNSRNGHSEKTLKTRGGDVLIQVPRDRAGTFDPIAVRKHSKMSEELEQTILLLYAKGMSTNDISDFMEHTYGVSYSKSAISLITDSLLKDIELWQNRPLERVYPIVWFDAIHYKIRQDGKVKSKACLIVLGVNIEGEQDILALRIYENEAASVWMEVFTELKARGVEDILYLCSDNLKGLDQAVEAVFPQSTRQICIVHQIRNSLKFVSYKDRRKIMVDIKKIYQAPSEKSARQALESFKENWQGKYHIATKSWEDNWENLTAFLHSPIEIRKLIYTTNIIESFNASLRKYTNNKKVFPSDDSAVKSIYLAAMQIRKKWQKRRWGWSKIYNQLTILYPERLNV